MEPLSFHVYRLSINVDKTIVRVFKEPNSVDHQLQCVSEQEKTK